jgi:hypothetical protein
MAGASACPGTRRVALCFALALSVGCHGKGSPVSDAALPPVEAPADLLAEGTVAAPDASWTRLQRGIGGAAGILPATIGGLICAASGLDTRLAAEISGTSPAYLVVAGTAASPSWVLAARLVEERRARPLFEGKGALFQTQHAGAGVVVIAGARPPPTNAVVGIAPGGWLVIGRSAAALAELSPYATRTLPSKTRVDGAAADESIGIDLPERALKGGLASAVAEEWSMAQKAMLDDDSALRAAHGGREPDFADPRAIVGALDGWMQGKMAALRDLRGGHVGIDVGDQGVRLSVTASPASAGGAAAVMVGALHPGDVAPLARVPHDSVLALFTRDDPAARARDAADLDATIVAALGPRLAPADAKRVHEAFDDWGAARGAWATLALTLTSTDRGVVADIASSDPARTARALREAAELVAHVPAIHDPFEAWLRAPGAESARVAARSTPDVTLGAAMVPGGGEASTATFTTASPFSLVWAPGPTDVRIALGAAPLPLLAPPLPGGALGDDPAMRAALGSIGSASAAIVAQPGSSLGCSPGSAVVAWGARPDAKGQAALWGTAVVSDSSLRCLMKSFF